MESLSLFSFAKSQSDYHAIPMLASTDLHQALAIIAKDEEMEENEVRLLISVPDFGVPAGLYFAIRSCLRNSLISKMGRH
jgi:hypothetical protein